MMANEKIILMIKILNHGIDLGDNIERFYIHIIGSSSSIVEGLKKEGFDKSWTEAAEEVVKKGEEGKFRINDFIIYVLPESMVNLHTCQYPLVVMKDDEVIDIDEYWYTPFRELLVNNYTCKPLTNFEDLSSELGHRSFSYVEYDFFVKCTMKNNDDLSPLIVTRTRNVTFNIC